MKRAQPDNRSRWNCRRETRLWQQPGASVSCLVEYLECVGSAPPPPTPPSTGRKRAAESYHGCHADHQTAGGDHRRVWEAQDSGHQGLKLKVFPPTQKKKCNFSCVQCFCKSSSWNQTVVISTVCRALLTSHSSSLTETEPVLSFQSSFHVLRPKSSCDSFRNDTKKFTAYWNITSVFPPFRKSLETLWRWRCCSTLRPWRCSPWPTRAFKT